MLERDWVVETERLESREAKKSPRARFSGPDDDFADPEFGFVDLVLSGGD